MSGLLCHLRDAETISDEERRNVVILAERPEITITWSRYAAGERGPDLHVHREHSDAFYVLDGELTFAVGPDAEVVRAAAGGYVAVPPNVVHSFVNDGSADAAWLNMHAPEKGFAAYLRALRDGRRAAFDTFDPPADGGLPAAGVIVSGPGEGERVTRGPHVALLRSAANALAVAEWTLDGELEGAGHDGRVDSYYVLEGQLDVTMDGAAHAAGPDTLVTIPAGVPHALAGTRARVVHFLA
jgi:quercetin dioxygenase-like cupin family protein